MINYVRGGGGYINYNEGGKWNSNIITKTYIELIDEQWHLEMAPAEIYLYITFIIN